MDEYEYADYTHEQLIDAHNGWRNTPFVDGKVSTLAAREANAKRQAAWDRYCDMRDCYVLGTSQRKRLEKEKEPMKAGVH